MSDKKTVIVTGGARGIGKAVVENFCARGAHVIIADRLIDTGEETASEIRHQGMKYDFVPFDFKEASDANSLMRKIHGRFGTVDILINNMGIGYVGPSDEIAEQKVCDIFNVNLLSVFWCTREFIPIIPSRGGCIVNTGSISGFMSNDFPKSKSVYNASKAGVHMLTRSFASEYGRIGVRVNAVAPGYTETEMHNATLAASGLDVAVCHKAWTDRVPLNRIAQPSEIANAIAFLASDDASYITGAVLTVDGGYSLG